jgi:hypothetical protein
MQVSSNNDIATGKIDIKITNATTAILLPRDISEFDNKIAKHITRIAEKIAIDANLDCDVPMK